MSKAKRDFNGESLDLWLGAAAGGYTYPRDDSEENNPNKKGSRVPINMVWMQAMSDPRVQETNECLERIFTRMERENPTVYAIFEYLYFRDEANPAEAEVWRRDGSWYSSKDPQKMDEQELREDARRRGNADLWDLLQVGKVWVLDQVEKELDEGCKGTLVVPDEVDPEGFVRTSEKNQRTARKVFWSSVDEHGEQEARRRAAKQSGFSLRHVRNLLPPGISKIEKRRRAG